MATLPAIVWRGGPVCRAATVGLCVGLFFGVLAWLDSGMLVAGLAVLVVLGVGSGAWTARSMTRQWPGSRGLNAAERETVVTTVRRGDRISDAALAPAVVDYGRALHGLAEKNRLWRWTAVFVLIVAAVMALWDAVHGSLGNVVASAVYVLLAGLELFWWPKRQAQLLTNADRAAALARQDGISD